MFRVQTLGFRCLGSRIKGLGFWVEAIGLYGLGSGIHGLGFGVSTLGIRVSGLGCWVYGQGFCSRHLALRGFVLAFETDLIDDKTSMTTY